MPLWARAAASVLAGAHVFSSLSDRWIRKVVLSIGPGRGLKILLAWLLVSGAFAQRQNFRFYGQEQGLGNLATECLFRITWAISGSAPKTVCSDTMAPSSAASEKAKASRVHRSTASSKRRMARFGWLRPAGSHNAAVTGLKVSKRRISWRVQAASGSPRTGPAVSAVLDHAVRPLCIAAWRPRSATDIGSGAWSATGTRLWRPRHSGGRSLVRLRARRVPSCEWEGDVLPATGKECPRTGGMHF